MRRANLRRAIVPAFAIIGLVYFGSAIAWSHERDTRIVPSSLSVRSGSDLEVTVNGLVDAQTAAFRLTGLTSKYKLGEFPIKSDDFAQTLKIPANLSPGSYLLSVEGGGKTAKVVISIY